MNTYTKQAIVLLCHENNSKNEAKNFQKKTNPKQKGKAKTERACKDKKNQTSEPNKNTGFLKKRRQSSGKGNKPLINTQKQNKAAMKQPKTIPSGKAGAKIQTKKIKTMKNRRKFTAGKKSF